MWFAKCTQNDRETQFAQFFLFFSFTNILLLYFICSACLNSRMYYDEYLTIFWLPHENPCDARSRALSRAITPARVSLRFRPPALVNTADDENDDGDENDE